MKTEKDNEFYDTLIGDKVVCPKCEKENKNGIHRSKENEDTRTTIKSLKYIDEFKRESYDTPYGTKALIYKASLPTFWYADKIGDLLNIDDHLYSEYFYFTQDYQCEHTTGYIFKGDCMLVFPDRFYEDEEGKEYLEKIKSVQESALLGENF